MYFSSTPKTYEPDESDLENAYDLKISWDYHIKALTKKLSCCTGSLNQIIESIPENLHKDLYHTLFESYLTYGISVWGGSTKPRLNFSHCLKPKRKS